MKINFERISPSMFEPLMTADFLRTIPTLDIWSKMFLYLYHKNRQAKVEKNDLLDVTHLSVAVTYCDVVACDKNMARVLRASKLDKQYHTQVFERLADATDYLEGLVS